MRRILVTPLLVIAVAALAVLLAGGGGGDEGRRYTVELDNAFGLVEGGDVRVAGANAGRVVELRLDERTQKALVDVEITERGFGSLRSDVFCESRPQSPIGEYFLDCLPGTAKRELAPGSRVPVKQTASTIPPDLIQNIMRLPYRERFRLIVNEFGAGLAGRPQDLNQAIRRGVPALRQTSRLLEVLAEHDTVIRDLVTDADTVLKRLSDNRRDVGRFVVEAVCFTGTRLPGSSSLFAVPGRQSRKYSPIGDCGRDSQNTSERSDPKPRSVISTSISAFRVRSSSLSFTTRPALAPATRTSPPSTRPNALSSSTV